MKSKSKISFSGKFPWEQFAIHINENKIYLGWLKNNNANYKLIQQNDFFIGFYSYTPDTCLLQNNEEIDNKIICIGEYNTFLNNSKKNFVYVSTHCFHNYSEFNFSLECEKLYDGMIVSNNINLDKRRYLIKKLQNYKILSFSPLKEEIVHTPNDFNYYKTFSAVPRKTLSQYYNSTSVSFTFSSTEGECRSSLESLLCGCPVITTKPTPLTNFNKLPVNGGRMEAFGPFNSIACSPNEDDVLNTFETYLTNIKNYDREFISKNAKIFLFTSKIQLLKILNHVISNVYNDDFAYVIEQIKTSDFYNLYSSELDYYLKNYF